MYVSTASQQASIQVPAGTAYGDSSTASPVTARTPRATAPASARPRSSASASHTLSVDSQSIATLTPWRAIVPASSRTPVSASTAWGTLAATPERRGAARQLVPGSETLPFVFDAGSLAASGNHTVDWTIKRIDDGAGFGDVCDLLRNRQ